MTMAASRSPVYDFAYFHRRPRPVRDRLRDWRDRYLLAELLGTLAAVGAGTAAYALTGSLATMALVASLAETVGFYLGIAIKVAPGVWQRHKHIGGRLRVVRTLRSALAEASDYVVAELLDTLLLRPALILLASAWTDAGLLLGLLLGKVLADVAYYSVVIPMYELRRRLTGVPG
jgi:uncharacterized membrane protein